MAAYEKEMAQAIAYLPYATLAFDFSATMLAMQPRRTAVPALWLQPRACPICSRRRAMDVETYASHEPQTWGRALRDPLAPAPGRSLLRCELPRQDESPAPLALAILRSPKQTNLLRAHTDGCTTSRTTLRPPARTAGSATCYGEQPNTSRQHDQPYKASKPSAESSALPQPESTMAADTNDPKPNRVSYCTSCSLRRQSHMHAKALAMDCASCSHRIRRTAECITDINIHGRGAGSSHDLRMKMTTLHW